MSKSKVHCRRCHLCGHFNESHDGAVERCFSCHKYLAPFYYFNETQIAVPGAETLRPPSVKNNYKPIEGLTAYWSVE